MRSAFLVDYSGASGNNFSKKILTFKKSIGNSLVYRNSELNFSYMIFFKRTLSDADLIAGIRAGGMNRRNCENCLYDQFRYLIREATFKHKLLPEECSTAYSDAVLTVIEHISSQRYEGRSGLKTYLYQIFYNKCVDLVRKNSTNRESVHQGHSLEDLSIADETRTVLQKLISDSEVGYLRQQLSRLGDKCQQMLLAWGEGFSDEEIARNLDYQSSAVAKTSRLRCLEKLRNLYRKP